jgi:hypothetical protein
VHCINAAAVVSVTVIVVPVCVDKFALHLEECHSDEEHVLRRHVRCSCVMYISILLLHYKCRLYTPSMASYRTCTTMQVQIQMHTEHTCLVIHY